MNPEKNTGAAREREAESERNPAADRRVRTQEERPVGERAYREWAAERDTTGGQYGRTYEARNAADGMPQGAAPERAEEHSNGTPVGDRPGGTPRAGGTSHAGGERVRHRLPFPGWVDLLAFFGIYLLSNVAGAAAALLAGLSWPSETTVAAAAGGNEAAQIALGRFNGVSYLAAMSLTLAGLLLYRWRRGGTGLVARFSLRGLNPALLLWGVAFMVATSVVLEPLLALLPPVPEVYGRGWWAALMLVGAAPLFEETVFRGVVLESTRARYGVVTAWLVSSVIFAVVHIHPTVAVNAFFMGLILGYIYLAAESLWASIVLHAVNNGLAYLLLTAGYGAATLSVVVGNRTLYLVIYSVAALLFLASGFMVVRTLRALKPGKKNSSEA